MPSLSGISGSSSGSEGFGHSPAFMVIFHLLRKTSLKIWAQVNDLHITYELMPTYIHSKRLVYCLRITHAKTIMTDAEQYSAASRTSSRLVRYLAPLPSFIRPSTTVGLFPNCITNLRVPIGHSPTSEIAGRQMSMNNPTREQQSSASLLELRNNLDPL